MTTAFLLLLLALVIALGVRQHRTTHRLTQRLDTLDGRVIDALSARGPMSAVAKAEEITPGNGREQLQARIRARGSVPRTARTKAELPGG